MDRQPTVSPWLIVENGAAAIEFYQRAFAATVLYRVPGDGVAQLRIGGGEFWLSEASQGRFTPRQLDGPSHWVLLTVADPDEVWAAAVAAGATPDSSISESHGWRSGSVTDPDGHRWEIGTPVVEWPPEAN